MLDEDEEGDACARDQILGGRYRVRRRVGKGTFSEIYEAADLHGDRPGLMSCA